VAKTVALPLWLVVLLGALLAWALADRVLLPVVRRFFARREERFLEKLKKRFHLLVPAFKVARRRTLIERLVSDPQVLSAVDDYCREHGSAPEAVLRRVRDYAGEIVPSFHAFAYYYLGSLVGLTIARLLYRVRRVYADEAKLAGIAPTSSLVFLMNHRSNMDYVLLGYLTRAWAPPSFAVGEWAGFWPVRPLVKSMGAYFVRRGSRSTLYRRVLAAYIQMAVEGGQVQAVFLEGKLSRDGSLQEPKAGILDYILRRFDPGGERDVVFVPVGVNYDRVLEDRSLVPDQVPGANKKRGFAAAAVTLRFIGRNLLLMVRGGWHRLGYAVLHFGLPVSLRDYVRSRGIDFRALAPEARAPHIRGLARELLDSVGRTIPALPVSLVSAVLVENPGRIHREAELKGEVEGLIERLGEAGARVYLPRRSMDYAVEVGLRSLVLRHLVLRDGGSYRAAPGEMTLLRYYANSIAHLRLFSPSARKPEGKKVVEGGRP
jgi:glycerol-3-phosphate O-acyltransferase